MKLKDLNENSNHIKVKVKVLEKTSERCLKPNLRVGIFIISDETSKFYFTIWNDEIDKMPIGKMITIKNGYVSSFKGKLYLNIGRFGSWEYTDDQEMIINLSDEDLLKHKIRENVPRERIQRLVLHEESWISEDAENLYYDEILEMLDDPQEHNFKLALARSGTELFKERLANDKDSKVKKEILRCHKKN